MLAASVEPQSSADAPNVDNVLGFALGAEVGRRLSRLGLLVEPSVSEGICVAVSAASRGRDEPFLLRFWMVAPDI